MLVKQNIPALTGGVSQKPHPQRRTSEATSQTNAYNHPTLGLLKRPALEHLVKLTSSITGFDTALVHPINLSDTEQFLAVISDGTLVVYDASDGSAVSLETLQADDYLDVSGSPSVVPFRAVQVDHQTILSNNTIPVARGTETSPNKQYQALVSIEQADFGTQYNLTLDGQEIGFGSAEGITPQSRASIDTTRIAETLKGLIEASAALDPFTITQYGSTLLVEKTDGTDFTIAGDDGLADNGLAVIKGTVQRFTDLPVKAPEDFIIEVTGEPDNDFDNYFVRFDITDAATNAGVWKECVKPGELISLDEETLPHVLTYKGSLVPPSEAAGTPPAPLIYSGGGALQTNQWDAIGDSNETESFTADSDNLKDTIGDGNGIETEYEVFFRVDTRRVDPPQPIYVTLSWESGGPASDVWTEVDRNMYGPETLLENQRLAATLTLPANYRLQLKLKYADNTTPTNLWDRAVVRTNPETDPNYPAIRYFLRTGRVVEFNPDHVYPQGARVRVTCDGTNFDYTPATDVTGSVVASTLKTTIDASATYVATNPSAGKILVVRADSANTVVTCTITWVEATSYHDPDLAMTPSDLIGATVKNLTDGSEGAIAANTATTITVASISGGGDNSFQKGDNIEVVNSGVYFTFGPATWVNRAAGDLTTNPMPAIVGKVIDEVFSTRGRLGLVAQSNVVLSESGNFWNLFRTTATQIVDGDPIDVKPAKGDSVRFHSYTSWDKRDVLWSGRPQFELGGVPLLTPKTVSLLPISEYPTEKIRPVVLGRHAYFISKRSNHSQVYAYGLMEQQDKPEAAHLTQDIPTYIEGNVLAIAGDEDLGVFVVLTDADRSKLYVHTFNREAKLFAWTRWQLPAGTTIVGLSFLVGVLSLVSKRSDGVYLETIDFDERV